MAVVVQQEKRKSKRQTQIQQGKQKQKVNVSIRIGADALKKPTRKRRTGTKKPPQPPPSGGGDLIPNIILASALSRTAQPVQQDNTAIINLLSQLIGRISTPAPAPAAVAPVAPVGALYRPPLVVGESQTDAPPIMVDFGAQQIEEEPVPVKKIDEAEEVIEVARMREKFEEDRKGKRAAEEEGDTFDLEKDGNIFESPPPQIKTTEYTEPSPLQMMSKLAGEDEAGPSSAEMVEAFDINAPPPPLEEAAAADAADEEVKTQDTASDYILKSKTYNYVIRDAVKSYQEQGGNPELALGLYDNLMNVITASEGWESVADNTDKKRDFISRGVKRQFDRFYDNLARNNPEEAEKIRRQLKDLNISYSSGQAYFNRPTGKKGKTTDISLSETLKKILGIAPFVNYLGGLSG